MAEGCGKSVRNIALWLILCIMYLCLGMAIFVAFEAGNTDIIIAKKEELRENLHKELWGKMNVSQQQMADIMNRIKEAFTPPPVKWTYLNAFALSLQTITTIGYGNITPLTSGGRVFCIFYSLFGIPLAALLLQATGNSIYGLLRSAIVHVEMKMEKRSKVHSIELKSLVASLFLLFLLILIFAVLLGYKGNTYLEGVYGWFITLTTIGYGDVVPGQRNDNLVFVWLRVLFMFIGLSFTASILSSLGSWMGSRNLKICKCCRGLVGRIINKEHGNNRNNMEMKDEMERQNEGKYIKKDDEQADHKEEQI